MPTAGLSRPRAIFELVFTAFLWGVAFLVVRWLLLGVGPLWLNTFRMLAAFGLGCLLVPFIPGLRQGFHWRELVHGWKPGIWLGAALIFQTYGLPMTTVAKSGFITCLYVVIVPVLGRLFYGHRIARAHLIWLGIAIWGMAWMCELAYAPFNLGDALTFVCSIFCALQILDIGELSPRARTAFTFNLSQLLWAGVLPLCLAPWVEPLPKAEWVWEGFAALAFLTVGCTLLAFSIQVRTQRVLSASLVSLLCLLESPFAALGGYLYFQETLTLTQALGACLILVAAVGSIYTDRPRAA